MTTSVWTSFHCGIERLRAHAGKVVAAALLSFGFDVTAAHAQHQWYDDVRPYQSSQQVIQQTPVPRSNQAEMARFPVEGCAVACAMMLLHDRGLPTELQLPAIDSPMSAVELARQLKRTGGLDSNLYLPAELQRNPYLLRQAVQDGKSVFVAITTHGDLHGVVADGIIEVDNETYYRVRDPWPESPNSGSYLKPQAAMELAAIRVVEPTDRPDRRFNPERQAARADDPGRTSQASSNPNPSAPGPAATPQNGRANGAQPAPLPGPQAPPPAPGPVAPPAVEPAPQTPPPAGNADLDFFLCRAQGGATLQCLAQAANAGATPALCEVLRTRNPALGAICDQVIAAAPLGPAAVDAAIAQLDPNLLAQANQNTLGLRVFAQRITALEGRMQQFDNDTANAQQACQDLANLLAQVQQIAASCDPANGLQPTDQNTALDAVNQARQALDVARQRVAQLDVDRANLEQEIAALDFAFPGMITQVTANWRNRLQAPTCTLAEIDQAAAAIDQAAGQIANACPLPRQAAAFRVSPNFIRAERRQEAVQPPVRVSQPPQRPTPPPAITDTRPPIVNLPPPAINNPPPGPVIISRPPPPPGPVIISRPPPPPGPVIINRPPPPPGPTITVSLQPAVPVKPCHGHNCPGNGSTITKPLPPKPCHGHNCPGSGPTISKPLPPPGPQATPPQPPVNAGKPPKPGPGPGTISSGTCSAHGGVTTCTNTGGQNPSPLAKGPHGQTPVSPLAKGPHGQNPVSPLKGPQLAALPRPGGPVVTSTGPATVKPAVTTPVIRPNPVSRPAPTYKPVVTARPTPIVSRPAATYRPVVTARPTPVVRPAATYRPVTAARPAATHRPVTAARPAATHRPVTAARPAATYRPVTAARAHARRY